MIDSDRVRRGGGALPVLAPAKTAQKKVSWLPFLSNPDLYRPDAIVCNGGAAAHAAVKTLARQAGATAVFIKLETDLFRYVGQFSVSESLTAPLDCAPYAHRSSFTVGQVTRVIRMNRF